MEYFAGLDVSVKDTSVCIVEDTGKIIREVKVASEPDALLAVLKSPCYHFKRIGLEAGPSRSLASAALVAGWLRLRRRAAIETCGSSSSASSTRSKLRSKLCKFTMWISAKRMPPSGG